jgi:hypothetical protein
LSTRYEVRALNTLQQSPLLIPPSANVFVPDGSKESDDRISRIEARAMPFLLADE